MRYQDHLPESWPTWAVVVALYSLFALTTWFYHDIPGWVILLIGGYSVAWHGSLQHEVIHGHPTKFGWINRALVYPNVSLWLPFGIYRETHLAHHRNEHLTDPHADPESYYLPATVWQRLPRWLQTIWWLNNTVVGRLLLGPWLIWIRFACSQGLRLLRGDRGHLKAWLLHLPAVAIVLLWTSVVCEIPVIEYVLLFVYPGTALTLLRAFAEHRAAVAVAERSVIVEAAPLWSLLYLNNNLHAVHHARPDLPWYRLAAAWRAGKDEILRANSGYHFDGYTALAQRYALRAKESPWHPLPRLQHDGQLEPATPA